MNISKHAIARSQQRGIPMDDIDLIMQFGKPQHKPGGAIEYSVTKKDKSRMIVHLKRLINHLHKVGDKGVLVIEDEIITVYHRKK